MTKKTNWSNMKGGATTRSDRRYQMNLGQIKKRCGCTFGEKCGCSEIAELAGVPSRNPSGTPKLKLTCQQTAEAICNIFTRHPLRNEVVVIDENCILKFRTATRMSYKSFVEIARRVSNLLENYEVVENSAFRSFTISPRMKRITLEEYLNKFKEK